MSEAQTLTAVGTVGGITEKPSGWFEVEIQMPGKQYPLKLATKKAEIIAAVRGVGTEIATFTYKESDGNPNPHQPGTFYKNRYLEGVEAGATAEAQQAAQAVPTAGGSQPESLSKDEWRRKDSASDMRACIAIAAGTLEAPPLEGRTVEQLNAYNAHVLHLAKAWHQVVSAERDGDDIPF